MAPANRHKKAVPDYWIVFISNFENLITHETNNSIKNNNVSTELRHFITESAICLLKNRFLLISNFKQVLEKCIMEGKSSKKFGARRLKT